MTIYHEEASKKTFTVYKGCSKFDLPSRFSHVYLDCSHFLDSGNRKDAASFGWLERYRVAVGVAEALDYLHNTHDPGVIHRDVKSSNVLLADDFEPQVLTATLSSFIHRCDVMKQSS